MEERRLIKQTTFKDQKYHVCRFLLFVNLGSVGRETEEMFSSLPVFYKLSYHTHFSGTGKAGVGCYLFERGWLSEMIQAVTQTPVLRPISEMASLTTPWHLSTSSLLSLCQVRRCIFEYGSAF